MKSFIDVYEALLEDVDLAKVSSGNHRVSLSLEIMNKLKSYGTTLIVGGAVRDILMGKIPHDVDLATNVPMDTIERIFNTHDIGKNKAFGIVVVDYKGETFEIAQFRSESTQSSDGRHPDFVRYVKSFESDAIRRDFTINALGMDSEGHIIDFTNGQRDITDGIIKAVGDPNQRFAEDYLRMLRAIRFSAKLGFKVDQETFQAIKKGAANIKNLSPDRIYQELMKMASEGGDSFANALELLQSVGLLEYILPELSETLKFDHDPKHHPENIDGKHSVWAHILAAVRSSGLKDPIINLAIALHDIGKIKTFAKDGDKITYINHAKEGVEIINTIANRLKMDNRTKNALMFAAEHHMKLHDLVGMSRSKVLALMNDDNWNVLYNVSLADAKSRGTLFDPISWQKTADYVEELTDARKASLNSEALKKIVNGKLVMGLCGIKPGKKVGEIISKTLDWIVDNDIDLGDSARIENFILLQKDLA